MKILFMIIISTSFISTSNGLELDIDQDGRIDYWGEYNESNQLVAWKKDTNGDGKADHFTEWRNSDEEIIKQDRNHDGNIDIINHRQYRQDRLYHEIVLEDRNGDNHFERKIERDYLYSESTLVESHYLDEDKNGEYENEEHFSSPITILAKAID